MSDKKQLVKGVVTGTVCGLLVTMLLNIICAAVMLKTGLLPAELTGYIVCGLLAAGAVAAGITATKITRSAGLIESSETVGVMTVIKLASCLAFGGLGGILGLKENKRIKI